MPSFLSNLGTGLEQTAKGMALRSPVGRAIAAGMPRYRQQHSATDPGPQIPSQETADAMSEPSDSLGGMNVPVDPNEQAAAMSADPRLSSAFEPMAHGRMVTKPTLALLGERGPEAVVPMNTNPENKVSMPPTPGILRPPEMVQPRYPRYRR